MNNRYALKPVEDYPLLIQPSAAPTATTGREDIHPLKPLQTVDFPWAMLLGGLLLAVVLSLGVWWWVKHWLKRQQPELPETMVSQSLPVTTALDVALKELDALETDILRQDCTVFYFRLEHILRQYLESTRMYPATALTQTELQLWLKQQRHLLWAPERLQPMLQHSLMAKFARQPYDTAVLQQDRELVRVSLIADARELHTKQG